MPRGRPKKNKIEETVTTEYQIQGQVKTISAMCRQSVSIHNNYYTFEYKEERELPLNNNIDLAKEKESLWYSVNSEVDKQINDQIEWIENQR